MSGNPGGMRQGEQIALRGRLEHIFAVYKDGHTEKDAIDAILRLVPFAESEYEEVREALECAEYALTHPESNQAFALDAVRDVLGAMNDYLPERTRPGQSEPAPTEEVKKLEAELFGSEFNIPSSEALKRRYQLLSSALRAADLEGYRRAFNEAPDYADVQEAVVKKLGAVSKDALEAALRAEREKWEARGFERGIGNVCTAAGLQFPGNVDPSGQGDSVVKQIQKAERERVLEPDVIETILRVLDNDFTNATDNVLRGQMQQKRMPYDHDNNDAQVGRLEWQARTKKAIVAIRALATKGATS